MAKLSDTQTRPIVNLAGLEGSRRPSFHQIQAKTGASTTSRNGATRLQPARRETECPNTSVRVLRWANRLRVEPACSKTDQKMVAATKSTRTTTSRFRSSAVHLPAVNIQRKNSDRGEHEHEAERIADALGRDRHHARHRQSGEDGGADHDPRAAPTQEPALGLGRFG